MKYKGNLYGTVDWLSYFPIGVTSEDIDKLLDERDRLREALKFYAGGEWNERYPCGVLYDHDEAIIDFGQVARAALKEDNDG